MLDMLAVVLASAIAAPSPAPAEPPTSHAQHMPPIVQPVKLPPQGGHPNPPWTIKPDAQEPKKEECTFWPHWFGACRYLDGE